MNPTPLDHQARWQEIVQDPSLQNLPYTVETNERGQLLLSPHSNRHSHLQAAVQDLLRTHAPSGHQPPEFALATPAGVKTPDVVWMSPERRAEMEATGDPSTLAPEICVEVLSPANTEAELTEKRRLYRDLGAKEVWWVTPAGRIRFFADGERDASMIAPECPSQIEAG